MSFGEYHQTSKGTFIEDLTVTNINFGTASFTNLTVTGNLSVGGTETVNNLIVTGSITLPPSASFTNLTVTGTENCNNLVVSGTTTTGGISASGNIATPLDVSCRDIACRNVVASGTESVAGALSSAVSVMSPIANFTTSCTSPILNCGTLNYTTLNPPISSGGFSSGRFTVANTNVVPGGGNFSDDMRCWYLKIGNIVHIMGSIATFIITNVTPGTDSVFFDYDFNFAPLGLQFSEGLSYNVPGQCVMEGLTFPLGGPTIPLTGYITSAITAARLNFATNGFAGYFGVNQTVFLSFTYQSL